MGMVASNISSMRSRSLTCPIRFFNILADDDVREGLKVFSDWPTFPQLYTGGELIGGLDIVSLAPNGSYLATS